MWGLGFLLSACGSTPALEHTYPSPFTLAEGVLDALARRDRAALERLALSEREFSDRVWPSLPSARPERNLPLSFVWGDLHQKSQAALGETLGQHGGRRYRLLGVDFSGLTNYGSYRVHREAALRVSDASGTPATIRACGSMIETDGRWKVFSYVVD